MDHQDAIRFLENECQIKAVSLSLPQHMISLLVGKGGVPLAMTWMYGLVGIGYPIDESFSKLGSETDDIAMFSFKGTID